MLWQKKTSKSQRLQIRLLKKKPHYLKYLMYSWQQVFNKTNYFKLPAKTSRFLRHNAQKKGQILRVKINTPRKPNSARRKTIKFKCTNKLKPVAYIPGGEHNLKKFSTVLVRGRGPRDTPGVYLSAIRGKFDFAGCPKKIRRRSIYGKKKVWDTPKPFKKERRKKLI